MGDRIHFELIELDLDIFRAVQKSTGVSIKDIIRSLRSGGLDKSEFTLYHRMKELGAAGFLELRKKNSSRAFSVHLTTKSRHHLAKMGGDADA